MQIQVINERERDTAIAEIRRLNSVMAQFGDESRTVFAEAYGADGLVDALEIRANRGQLEILVLDCTGYRSKPSWSGRPATTKGS